VRGRRCTPLVFFPLWPVKRYARHPLVGTGGLSAANEALVRSVQCDVMRLSRVARGRERIPFVFIPSVRSNGTGPTSGSGPMGYTPMPSR
jgi:hypothetical protein